MEITPHGPNRAHLRIDTADEQQVLRQAVYRSRKVAKLGMERLLQTKQPAGTLTYPRQVLVEHAQLDLLVEDMSQKTVDVRAVRSANDPLGPLRDRMIVGAMQYFMSREEH